MRIAYCSDSYTVHDYRFLSKLADTEHEVWYVRFSVNPTVFEPRPIPERIRVAQWQGVTGFKRNLFEKLKLYLDFKRVIREIKPDVIHAGPVQICGFFTALAGFRPLLLMPWGSDILVFPERNRLWLWVTRYTFKRADLVTCDCQRVADKIVQLTGYPRDRIVIIPWGIELQEFHPRPSQLGLRRQLGWDHNPVIIVTRNLEPIYGIDVFLRAFRKLLDRCPDARAILVGDGSQGEKLRDLSRTLGLADCVHWAGRVPSPQMADYLNEADVYCSTSYSDGSSACLMEALACGLPAVVSDIPSNQEWVTQGVQGWLTKPGDEDSIMEGLEHILKQTPDQRQAMKQACLEKAQRDADWDRNFGRLLEMYAQLKAERR